MDPRVADWVLDWGGVVVPSGLSKGGSTRFKCSILGFWSSGDFAIGGAAVAAK